jgi:hypothetical protein
MYGYDGQEWLDSDEVSKLAKEYPFLKAQDLETLVGRLIGCLCQRAHEGKSGMTKAELAEFLYSDKLREARQDLRHLNPSYYLSVKRQCINCVGGLIACVRSKVRDQLKHFGTREEKEAYFRQNLEIIVQTEELDETGEHVYEYHGYRFLQPSEKLDNWQDLAMRHTEKQRQFEELTNRVVALDDKTSQVKLDLEFGDEDDSLEDIG